MQLAPARPRPKSSTTLIRSTSKLGALGLGRGGGFCVTVWPTASLVILALIFAAGLVASHVAPYGFNDVNLASLSEPPSWAHPFGTNQIGSDYFTQILYGIGIEARVALLVAFFGTLAGTLVGVVAGYFGGIIGELLMRLTDLFLTFPPLI